ncbi:EscF/YscF/HrpA family type III secretion system needle major subunit [Lampropedia aestuarii]|uniref:EscF/YscF/HrpA family type III secretion system needle major subunit n=1 Tax=Lampropedia aestuarii TaxID=2562762 RepID=A0A4S5BPK3_9BURK|nr:type III secretion system needle filament subunit SctF [Lampropedia aestuarii]MDH5857315.1 type III secretion system needle filament subunit SctF [Lampropedia aestuarii]THJ31526.1 EscF/YscF/HrpA family type III secretion system needle major subunit [Lampropedia aestuarii]
MAAISPSSTGLSFDTITASFTTAFDSSTANVQSAMANLQNNPSDSSALLNMQMAMQKWSMMIELQGTLSKTLGDTMKGIIQKAS